MQKCTKKLTVLKPKQDIIYAAEDTVLDIPVKLRHCHSRQRHIQDEAARREAGEVILRSSVLSTNEFILVMLGVVD